MEDCEEHPLPNVAQDILGGSLGIVEGLGPSVGLLELVQS